MSLSEDSGRAAPERFRKIGVLGPGLIGGSFLLAIRKACPGVRLVAGARSRRTRDAVLAAGAADSVFDSESVPPAQGLSGCDLAILATPPAAVRKVLPDLRGADVGLVLDVASVKGSVMAAAAAAGLGNFIGGHPMAGNEGVGFGAADPALFRGAAFVYCVPQAYSAGRGRLDALLALLGSLGFRCLGMDPDEHDRRLAMVSHLPHVAAFALALSAERSADPALPGLVGGGFRDTTRIAASAPDLWTDILRSSPRLPEAIDSYMDALRFLRAALAPNVSPDVLREALETAGRYRRAIPSGLNPVPHASGEEGGRR